MAFRLQAAMEYLMTYGWAILIIAITLGALYQLGIFNSLVQGSHAQPGACRVYRQYGPYSTDFISLQGACSPDQLPLYVAHFAGQSSYVVSKSNLPAMANSTITWWMYVSSVPASGTGMGPGACQVYIPSTSGSTFSPHWDPCSCTGYSACSSFANMYPKTKAWVMLAFVINGNSISSYSYSSTQDLQSSGTTPSTSFALPSKNFYIGSYGGNPIYNHLNGSIANVQVYNASLSSSYLSALYQEGIGGPPLSDQLYHLVAWWPLNGNANDYSGNGNDAKTINTTFISSWNNIYAYP